MDEVRPIVGYGLAIDEEIANLLGLDFEELEDELTIKKIPYLEAGDEESTEFYLGVRSESPLYVVSDIADYIEENNLPFSIEDFYLIEDLHIS